MASPALGNHREAPSPCAGAEVLGGAIGSGVGCSPGKDVAVPLS